MKYTYHYDSPLGGITMASDGESLSGLWFDGQKYFGAGLAADEEEQTESGEILSVFEETKKWLDIYFDGKEPDFTPRLHLQGSPFRIEVWEILLKIPYGKTTTYKEIAERVAAQRGIPSMSAQAVGGAVGHNPISIIVPCHRILGTDGSLTGYAGGVEKKKSLLALEQGGK